MSEKIFEDLQIRKPDIHLEVSTGSPILQVTEMMLNLEDAMRDQKPDLVMIFGDTNSTLAGAMVASKLTIPILHIEAGLRSYNRKMPEEVNRIIADHVASFLFAPTETAFENLKKEGLSFNSFLTGDIMVDTLKNNLPIALQSSNILEKLKLEEDFNLLTLHRNYNVDDAGILENVLLQLGKLEEKIIFPVHPRTKKMLSENHIAKNIVITEPQGYLDFITLENSAKRIITDSGGIQKEAYILKKPCITLRTETEWLETVEQKWNLLIDPADKQISKKILNFSVPETQENVFGENVAEKMVSIINEIQF